MNWKAQGTACIFAIVLLVSCEEVIELDLGSAAPRIVIEGVITNQKGPFTIKISQSVNYQELNFFPPVSGASVRLSDGKGNTHILREIAEGEYKTDGFQGKNGETYFLEVAYEGEVYTASSTIPSTPVPINSISYQFLEESIFNEEGYYMTAYFTDPANEENYYRLKVFINGENYLFEVGDKRVKDDNFWLINDKFFNGQMMDYEFPHLLEPGDKVALELHQVDKGTYDYYRTLVELMGIGVVAPANPLTNWSNGALGYFGAVSLTYASISIEEQ